MQLRIIATVDEQVVFQNNTQPDTAGRLHIEFNLPKKIERGDCRLSVTAENDTTRETLTKTIPVDLHKVDVRFCPEGGELVEGLENRVYFVARSPLGKPIHLKGTIVDGRGAEVAAVETLHEGMGSFRLVPRTGETYRLKIASPAGLVGQPELPAVSTGRIVLSTGPGVFDAGAPLDLTIRAAKAKVPLVVAASCRGVPVGQQALVAAQDSGAIAVSLPLDEQARGVIRLIVYDYSASPPKPLAGRLVYRRPARRLTVHASPQRENYAPGDKVAMSLAVTDETGRPVPATLGVTAVDAGFLPTTNAVSPEDLDDADFSLADAPKAAVALDLLLATEGGEGDSPIFGERKLGQSPGVPESRSGVPSRTKVPPGRRDLPAPPLMLDNLGDLRASYEEDIAQYRAKRTWTLNTLVTLSFFGGLGLTLLVTMLALLKVASGVRLWGPASSAAWSSAPFSWSRAG